MGHVKSYGHVVRLMKKNKPGWQDKLPRNKPELKDAYEIAAKHEGDFAKAVIQFQKEFLDDETKNKLKTEWKKGSSLNKLLKIVPAFNKKSNAKIWTDMATKLAAAYKGTVVDSGIQATKDLNKQFGTKFKVEIKKASKKRKVLIVPVNPHSIEWMRKKALSLVGDTLAGPQIDVIRSILIEGFKRGIRAEVLLSELQESMGLDTARHAAVESYRKKLEDQDVPIDKVDTLVGKYRTSHIKKRAMTIARTETIAAQAQGRNKTWELAQASGKMPPIEREWSAAPESPNPDRPCEICAGDEGLDGTKAPVGGEYSSPIIGPVRMPPAHPNCRCTEKLVRKK